MGRRARQRAGVQVSDLVDALGELPAVRGEPVAVVVHGVIQLQPAVAEAPELADVGAAGRGGAVKLDRARVRGLHENTTGCRPGSPCNEAGASRASATATATTAPRSSAA